MNKNHYIIYPFLFFGILIKYYLFSIGSDPYLNWYRPFLEFSSQNLSFDPWKSWIDGGGNPLAFPYGYAMWISFVPFFFIFNFFDFHLVYFSVICFFEFLTCYFVFKSNDEKISTFLFLWVSPVVLFATYLFGFNDIIPIAFTVGSLYFLKKNRCFLSGIFVALSVSAKLSMIISIPFYFIYFYRNKPLRNKALNFFYGFIIIFTIFILPFLYSDSGLTMLYSNPEMNRVFELFVEYEKQQKLFIIPILYLSLLLYFFNKRKLNFDLFICGIGISFLLIVLLSSSSPGWYVWFIPILSIINYRNKRKHYFLITLFSIVFVIHYLPQFNLFPELFDFQFLKTNDYESLTRTVLIFCGLVLAFYLWKYAINKNNFLRFSNRPFSIGVAGDSASGKDTFIDSIENLFGHHSVTKLSGDDYHLWDRNKPVWNMLTHLNPMSNNLEKLTDDVIKLINSESIIVRKYDHKQGILSKETEIEANDMVFVSGLHTLYAPLLRDFLDLKIYLDMDEDLRKYFKFHRDVNNRGHHPESLKKIFEQRARDSDLFIKPQMEFADVVFSLEPAISKIFLNQNEYKKNIPLRLVVITADSHNTLSLRKVLISVCGLHVDINHDSKKNKLIITIMGDVSSEDILIASNILFPDLIELLDYSPRWAKGMLGVMQLFTLSHIYSSFRKRLLK